MLKSWRCCELCVDVKDFIPEPLESDIYEGFETLVEKANAWLEDLSGVVHVSLQSVLVQKGDRKSISLSQEIKKKHYLNLFQSVYRLNLWFCRVA